MPPKKEPPKLVKGAAAASASLAIELAEATEENARLVAETEQLQAKLDESEPAREAAEAAAAKAEAAHAAAQERLANLEATHLKEKAEAEAREAAAKAECAALSEQLEALKQRAVAQEELRRQMAETIHEYAPPRHPSPHRARKRYPMLACVRILPLPQPARSGRTASWTACSTR